MKQKIVAIVIFSDEDDKDRQIESLESNAINMGIELYGMVALPNVFTIEEMRACLSVLKQKGVSTIMMDGRYILDNLLIEIGNVLEKAGIKIVIINRVPMKQEKKYLFILCNEQAEADMTMLLDTILEQKTTDIYVLVDQECSYQSKSILKLKELATILKINLHFFSRDMIRTSV